jgi:phosphoglycolate phosphatase
MTERIIFLDLDGTLIDTSERHYQVYCKLTDILDLKDSLEKAEFWKLKRDRISTVEILAETDPEVLEKFSKLWIDNIEKRNNLVYDKLFSETEYLLSELREERLVLLTMRQNITNLMWELKKLNLYGCFESVLSCSPLSNKDKKKPLIEFMHEKKVFLDKNSIIVGDSEIDIQTGKMLNLTTVAVSQGIRSGKLLSSMNPDYCIETIIEVIDVIKRLNLNSM